MELKELVNKTLEIFSAYSVQDLRDAIEKTVINNETEKMKSFCDMVNWDLKKDWLQMIFQYYCADRMEKKQDFTPSSLAMLVSCLIGESEEVIDMCAGSGALTIARWAEYPDTRFILYEIDENVIPYLLFNMAIRNINATVHQTDILQDKTIKSWMIRKGDLFGYVVSV